MKSSIHLFSMIKILSLLLLALSITANAMSKPSSKVITGDAGSKLNVQSIADFKQPWAMTFLPNGDMLVTEKKGKLIWLKMKDASKVSVKGIPEVAYGGQGGLGDIIHHPQYQSNQLIYLSYAEEDDNGKKGAVVIQAKLRLNTQNPKLENIKTIWKQTPKVYDSGHYSHRLAFSPDGYLFITSGDRREQKLVQSWKHNLGKVIRLKADGSVPANNPFQDKGELAKTFWSTGHRNLLGIDFDQQGRLWTHEMGPQHGDELNLTTAGDNYGWPVVSWGNHYSGDDIPDHDTRSEFNAPEAYWVPSIAPSGLIIYNGALFPNYQGNAFIGGLVSQALIRVKISGNTAKEVERFDMNSRIREVEQGPKGAIWVLEDGSGKLLRLTPQG